MLQPFSQIEQAHRDTLITKAEGEAFDILARLFGLPRIASITVQDWRAGLQAAAWAPRGTRGTLYAFTRGILQSKEITFTATIDPAAPQTLTWVSGGGAGGFTVAHVGRWWRITSSLGTYLYWSTGPALLGGGVSATLTLCQTRTMYWRGADWSSLAAPETVTAVLLPFVERELHPPPFYKNGLWSGVVPGGKPYTVQVLLEGASYLPPGTYMQPLYLWRNLSTPNAAGSVAYLYPGERQVDVQAGAAPTSWIVEEAQTIRGLLVNADNANTAEVTPDPAPISAPARGGNHTITLYKNGVATALSVVLGAVATSAEDAVNSVAVVAGDALDLRVTADGAVSKGLGNPSAVVFVDRPVGQPKGGDVLEGVAVDGNQATGPWPIYLADGTIPEIAASLDALVMAGIQVEALAVDFSTLGGIP